MSNKNRERPGFGRSPREYVQAVDGLNVAHQTGRASGGMPSAVETRTVVTELHARPDPGRTRRGESTAGRNLHDDPQQFQPLPGGEGPFVQGDDILHEGEADEKALYRQYKSRIYAVNLALKEISSLLRMQHPITTYTARHSWASIAYQKDIPLSVISEGMGHHSEKMTRIYLASLDYAAIDRANCLVWGELLR